MTKSFLHRKCAIIILGSLFVACNTTMKIKNGTMAYQVKQYAVAVEMLEDEYRRENNEQVQAQLSSMLAKSHDISQNFGEALQWHDITDQLISTIGSREDLAYSLKQNERYEDAQIIFSELYTSEREDKYLREVDICKQAIRDLAKADNFIIESFKGNSKYSDYCPVFFEEDFIVFSSDRANSTGKEIYNWTGNAFSDLFIMNLQNLKVHNFDAILNTDNNEGTACFSQDFTEIFFTRCESIDQGEKYCRLYYSQRPNGFWMEPEALMFFNDKTNFAHPCLIENDSVLIFSASPEGSDNTYDLFYSVRVETGWSQAEIMPSPINSDGNEKFPSAYNDTLFFASDFHAGFGGYDIFKTHLRSNGSWAPISNVGLPINSGADDFGLIIKNDFKGNKEIELQGFFSSSRNTGWSDDIFFFSKFKKKDEPAEETEEEIVEESPEEFQIYLACRVVELVYRDDDPNKEIIARNPLNKARLKITVDDSIQIVRTDANGRNLSNIMIDQDVNVIASKRDYLTNSIDLDTKLAELRSDTTINIEIPLNKIVFDKEIVLNNIYYDYNEWFIREDAFPALDSLTDILALNPRVNIQLSSHTDCRGEDDFNIDLSQKRAQSAVDYLEAKGINKSRLVAKGYGETIPEINCVCQDCSEEQHQTNRRTTFKILKDR